MPSEFVPTELDRQLIIRSLFFRFDHNVGATVEEISANSTFSPEQENVVLEAMYLDGFVELADDGRYRLTQLGIQFGEGYKKIADEYGSDYDDGSVSVVRNDRPAVKSKDTRGWDLE